jgi:5-carboxymethyl-2-hydroxymuconate isomerase
MPHIIIECSQNIVSELECLDICQVTYNMLADTQLFSPNDIKSRIHSVSSFYVGPKGKAGSFVHVVIQILEGRDLAIRQELTKNMFDKLNQLFSHADSVTVDLEELSKETYQKRKPAQ